MQFQVPQFLDVEDKIIGPFTLKQFLYVMGGIGLGYMAQRFVSYVGYVLAAGFVGLGAALAYYRPNKKPLADMVESAFYYLKSSRLYIWRRREKKTEDVHLDLENFQSTKHESKLSVAPVSKNKLNDLSWSIDIDPTPGDDGKPGL